MSEAKTTPEQPTVNLELTTEDYKNIFAIVEKGSYDGASVDYVSFLKQKLAKKING